MLGITAQSLFEEAWQPSDTATLCFLRGNGLVLLIRKKRGLGAGKINAPGGRLEPGETPLQAAIRETEEEVGVTPLDAAPCAHLRFQFVDGYSLRCHAFIAKQWRGEAVETEEAVPIWTPEDAIPWEEMWEDDRHWLPRALDGAYVEAAFIFDGEKMLEGILR